MINQFDRSMCYRTSPFQEKQFSAVNTFLLNYNQQNLTLYHTLTRIPVPKRSHDIRFELNILNKIQKQTYCDPYNNCHEQEALSETFSAKGKYPQHSDAFWNSIPKAQSSKIVTNPFIDSQSYSHFGVIASKSQSFPGSQPIIRQISRDKQLIRRQFSNLKICLKRSPKKALGPQNPSSSLMNLYNKRRDCQQKVQNTMDNTEQFTFQGSPFSVRARQK